MAKKFYVAIDLAKNELLNSRVQNLASAPSSPVVGQQYYDTQIGKFGVYNGATWDYMGTSTSTGDLSSNTSTSVDGEIALFSGTNGKTVRRATGTGLAKINSGVLTTATAGSDYLTPTGNGSGLTGITESQISGLVTDLAAKAPLDSPTFTGTPTVPTPTSGNGIANKNYVDNSVQGLSWKQAVAAATTGNVTLSGSAPNVVDGVTLVAGDRILVKNQTTASQNGIYTVTTLGTGSNGTWARSSDADTSAEIDSMTVYVEAGTTNADTVWTLITDNPTINTSNLSYAQINGGATPTASTSTAGKVQLATQAETEAKSDSSKAVTPASLATYARKYTALIGDGSATAIPVTHGLGSQFVTAQVYEVASNLMVEVDVTLTSATQTTFTFATAPASNAFRVVITG